jgi:predicted DNA-binding transcriptional regulator AlpA
MTKRKQNSKQRPQNAALTRRRALTRHAAAVAQSRAMPDFVRGTEPKKGDRLVSKDEVLRRAGCTYPTLWKLMRAGKFPRPVAFGGKSAWFDSEVEECMAALWLRRCKFKGDEA